jgi:putative membrane protein
MASDKKPPGEPTEEVTLQNYRLSDLQDELPTEEAPKLVEAIVDDTPTRPMPRVQKFAAPIPVPASPMAKEFIDTLPSSAVPEETIGVFLEDIEGQDPISTASVLLPPPTELVMGRQSARSAPSTKASTVHPGLNIHEADTLTANETPWNGLHPVSLLVNIIPRGWKTLRGMWPILLFVVVGGEGMGMGSRLVDLFIILLFTLFSVWNTFIHWATLRYRIHKGRLEITSGLLNRRFRTIDPERIQNVELVQNLFHTWTGLVEVRIDTAGEQSTEGLLSALTVEEATILRNQLAAIGSLATAEQEKTETGQLISKMGLAEIFAYGLTQKTIGTVAVITAVGMELMSQIDPESVRDLTVQVQPTTMVAAFLLAFVASWAISALTSLLRFYGFKMTRYQDVIRTEQGLTTKRKTEIPLSKVQLVRADEPLLRRLMGYGTVLIETAGLGVIEGQVRQAEGMVPMVEGADLGAVATAAVPRADVDPWTQKLRPAHPRALHRALIAATIQSSVLIALGLLFLGPMKWVVLALLPVSLVSAWLDWRWQGWLITPTAVVSRRGFFNRRTFILARDKLQSVHQVQGPLMRIHGLSRVIVRVAGSQVSLPDTGNSDTQQMMAELSG